MKRLLPLSLLLTLAFSLNAQDTIVVQTLTWADNFRSGYYQFPDDPEQSYEKIIMRYNMRCHNAAVGSGNVGCYEWDYSCNTFITDPTRQDSFRRTHPSHLITGFSGETFPYTNTPPFVYTQYEQLAATIDSSALSWPAVGNGIINLLSSNAYPRSRQQYLYPAEDLIAAGLTAGPIHALQLEVKVAGGTIPYLRLRLQEVDRDYLNDGTQVVAGFQEVYFSNTTFNHTGWTTLPFYAPFTWDGTSDLLLEYSHNGSQTGPVEFAGHETPVHTGAAPAPVESHYLGLNGNGWLEVPSAALGMEQEVTVAFWTYGLPDVLPANNSILEARDDANRRQLNIHLPWGNGSIFWDCGNDGTGYDRINKTASPAEFEGRWQHWAFTKNATTGEMAIYLNGELWHSGTGLYRPIDASRMIVGANADGNNKYPGSLNNFSMWNKALTLEEIRALAFRDNYTNHPAQNALIVHYPFNEGSGLIAYDESGNGWNADLYGPNWQLFRGKDLQQNWVTIPYRYNIRFGQGETTLDVVTTPVIDSVPASPVTVVEFGVNAANNLEQLNAYETYAAGETYLYNEDGNVLAVYPVSSLGQIDVSTLVYFDKQPAKFELLSLVTPYGNGLDLGQQGKTFYFDVTDFAPVLQGERFLSMEMGGQNQEEIDIQFWFITGTPTREVLNIENIWPFQRGNFDPIQADQVFEPRTLQLLPEGNAYKLKASITGHGQNGEFVPRQHYLNVDGGSQDFVFDVWKECAENPIYPQGGTWIFDRAGWCPGAATDVHEYYLPETVGETVEIDYGVNGPAMDQANYLVAAQLVTYGARSFSLDAAIEAVIRPSKRVEFERFNPACNEPTIVIQNRGTTPLTSVDISYGVVDGNSATYTWTGNLAFLETAEVVLPVTEYQFWDTESADPTFFATLTAANGSTDEYANNNTMHSAFTPARVLDYENMIVQVRTNNRPQENRYTIRDAAGNVVMSRDNMAGATTYQDEIALPAGCYTMRFEDDGDDGLDFWYWAVVGENVGTGSVGIRRVINELISLSVYSMEADNGDGIQVDFIIPQTVGTEELTTPQRLSVYPNPTRDQATVELTGFDGHSGRWQLVHATGQVLQEQAFSAFATEHREQIDLSDLPAGLYWVKVLTNGKVYTREVVKMD